MRNRDKHSRFEKPDAALASIRNHEPAALTRKLSFQRFRYFMESGVDDAAVQPGGFFTGPRMFFNGDDCQAVQGEFTRDRCADNPAAPYDAGVEHRSGKSVKMPSAPSSRKYSISCGSFTVQT